MYMRSRSRVLETYDTEREPKEKHKTLGLLTKKMADITWLTASPKATKANSPPGASMRPTRMAAIVETPNSLPTNVTNNVFPIIKRPKIAEIAGKFDSSSFGSIDIPTWKNNPHVRVKQGIIMKS
jgi:hypothetical protein